ncbi:kinase-like domain-containing protein, partial [Thelephora terrestris]
VNRKVYARLDMIGKGGSSRVYKVLSHSNQMYAVKRVSLDRTDQETMSGYMNEISLLKRLEGNHRIIRLIDSEVKAGPDGSKGHLTLVMELGEIDMARLLHDQLKQPLNVVWVAYYWQQMLQAVHVIHEEKIVHSDLKPANFVVVRGQLKLIDFGIANAIANDTTNIHRESHVGTVNYMSPEAIELQEGVRRFKVGRPSDIWSLGCILYQMVYGAPPFHKLGVYQKMRAIPDPEYCIEYPEHATRFESPQKGGDGSPQQNKILDHMTRSVPTVVISTIKRCLDRGPKARATIPDLLENEWLGMRETEVASPPPPPRPETPPKPELGADEAIITPLFMKQLLAYAIQLGRAHPDVDFDDAFLANDGEVGMLLEAWFYQLTDIVPH